MPPRIYTLTTSKSRLAQRRGVIAAGFRRQTTMKWSRMGRQFIQASLGCLRGVLLTPAVRYCRCSADGIGRHSSIVCRRQEWKGRVKRACLRKQCLGSAEQHPISERFTHTEQQNIGAGEARYRADKPEVFFPPPW